MYSKNVSVNELHGCVRSFLSVWYTSSCLQQLSLYQIDRNLWAQPYVMLAGTFCLFIANLHSDAQYSQINWIKWRCECVYVWKVRCDCVSGLDECVWELRHKLSLSLIDVNFVSVLSGCTWQVPWVGACWHALWACLSVHWESGADIVSSLSSHHWTHLAAHWQGLVVTLSPLFITVGADITSLLSIFIVVIMVQQFWTFSK